MDDNAVAANLRDQVNLDVYWNDLAPKARAEAKVLGFTEDLWDSNHLQMDSHLFPLYATPRDDFTTREKRAMESLRIGRWHRVNSYRPAHLRNKARYVDHAHLTDAQIKQLSEMKTLLFITTHLSEEHERALRMIWKTGHAAILPDNDLNRGWCRVRGDSSSVVHNHEYLARFLACLDGGGSHGDCVGVTAVEHLEWDDTVVQKDR